MSYDSWKTTNPEDEFLGPDPWEQAEAEIAAVVERQQIAFRKAWPAHCVACGGWGVGRTWYENHGMGGLGEPFCDPCEAMGPEFCHRCGYEGFNEYHDGPCYWCGHNDDDGLPEY